MRGIDVNQECIEQAGKFYRLTAGNRADEEMILVSKDQIIRLLAWYGSLRADAACTGAGEKPGEVFISREATNE